MTLKGLLSFIRIWFASLWLKIVTRSAPGRQALAARYASNPLLAYPRNVPCWCGSQKKAKRCCLPTASRVCTVEQAMTIAPYVNRARVRRAYDTSV